jgi:hypothetical protein
MILVELIAVLMAAVAVLFVLLSVALVMAGIAGAMLLWLAAPVVLIAALLLWLMFPATHGALFVVLLVVLAVLWLDRHSRYRPRHF